jgi:tetratricopeptide (TPR) repeat protein
MLAVAWLVTLVPITASAQMGGAMSGRPGAGVAPQAPMDPDASTEKPDAAAKKAYAAGLKALAKAKEHDAAADKSPNPDKKAKELEKADDAYSRALDEFTEALANKGDMIDAWNYAGTIHLRLGAYAEAVDDFNHVLHQNAVLYPAIESRAEASLALDRLDEVKSAYMDLSSHAATLADQLMLAMQQWVKSRRADPKGMRADGIDAFDKWIQERAAAAKAAA